jgi:hypothetical protein
MGNPYWVEYFTHTIPLSLGVIHGLPLQGWLLLTTDNNTGERNTQYYYNQLNRYEFLYRFLLIKRFGRFLRFCMFREYRLLSGR